MGETRSSDTARSGRIKDARGCSVRQIDPVKLHVLGLPSIIPSETIRAMADELLPGVRRQRFIQLLSVVLSLLLVVGGTIIYFTYYSTWTGFDPVSITIHVLQFAIIFSGPILAFRIARVRYAHRVADVLLRHRHCPHCGYNIRGLTVDPVDGATVCPECGCAWKNGRDAPA